MLVTPKPRRRIRRCPIPHSTFTTYMDEGLMHFRAGSFRKAVFCYDNALELQPNNRGALVARSQCYLKLGDAETARRDAEAAFNTADPKVTYMRGLVQQAEALFALGLFEKALLQFHCGHRVRRDVDIFRIGVQKCQESIQTAILDRAGTQIEDLDDVLPMIKAMEALENRKRNPAKSTDTVTFNFPAKRDHCCIRPDASENDTNVKLKSPSTTRARWVAREVLGSMFHDMEYLKRFLRRPDIKSEQGSAPRLRQNANEALNYLKIREQFWKQQNPMYSRKFGLNFNNEVVSHYEEVESARQEASRRIKMDAAEGAVLKNISLIEHALDIGRARDCQLECDRTLRQIKEMRTTLLPRKAELICQILHYKGMAFIKLKSFDQAIETFSREQQIAFENHKTDIRVRAIDYLAKTFALKRSFAEAAEVWETLLPLSKTPLEKTYIFHEIGRCYHELLKLELAKYYATNSFEEALKIDDWLWAMNAKILQGQVEIKLNNFEKAGLCFREAEDLAVKCGNNGNASLLREGQQCIKVYLEKLAQEQAEPVILDDDESDDG